jgi:glycosyltransferase involved in cell wall biosynthesis
MPPMPETPKRILYVENGIGYGGAMICLRHLARNLDRERFVGRIVTGRTGPEYLSIPEDAEWCFIPDRRFDVVSYRRRVETWDWVTKVPGLGLLINQCISRVDDLGNFLPFIIGLWREARRFKPHIIHANNEPVCNRAALLLGKLLGIPTVCHVRGPQTGSWMMHGLYQIPDRFISVSRWIDRGIAGLGVPAGKRHVVYDGIELGQLKPAEPANVFRERFGIGEADFTVGLVGLLIPWKGQRIFIDAASRLRSRIPGLKMLIIGGTPTDYREYERELRTNIRNCRLEDTVVFTGHIGDMPTAYAALDIVVSASINPEPLGTVVIEAMAMGRPLVAPNHGGGAEMNTHDETALLFEPGSAESLADCILRIYQSPELGQRLGSAARQRALSTFDVGSHVDRVQEVYESLLDSG